MINTQNYLKAIVGALVAGLSAIATGLGDGSLSPQEYVYAAIATLVALGAVWAVPSSTASPAPSEPTPDPVKIVTPAPDPAKKS